MNEDNNKTSTEEVFDNLIKMDSVAPLTEYIIIRKEDEPYIPNLRFKMETYSVGGEYLNRLEITRN